MRYEIIDNSLHSQLESVRLLYALTCSTYYNYKGHLEDTTEPDPVFTTLLHDEFEGYTCLSSSGHLLAAATGFSVTNKTIPFGNTVR